MYIESHFDADLLCEGEEGGKMYTHVLFGLKDI